MSAAVPNAAISDATAANVGANTGTRAGANTGSVTDLRAWREAVPDDRMAHVLKETLRLMNRSLQVRLAEHGVSVGHWVFLRVLWEHDGLTQRELSERAGVRDPTTYGALVAMEELGYIRRERVPGNRRMVRVFITPAGLALKDVLVPLAIDTNVIALAGVSQRDEAVARRVLGVMAANLAADLANWGPGEAPLELE